MRPAPLSTKSEKVYFGDSSSKFSLIQGRFELIGLGVSLNKIFLLPKSCINFKLKSQLGVTLQYLAS